MKKIPFVLMVLDGWGMPSPDYPKENNAILSAKTPNFTKLWNRYPHTTLQTSGNSVGLPSGIMGNSEVGHLNLGAGRIVWQEITRIDKAIEKDDLESVESIKETILSAKNTGKQLHLMGLVSDGAVHSVDRHYFALLRLSKKLGVDSNKVLFHCFLDGRDTPPNSGTGYVNEIKKWMKNNSHGQIASVMGRYYAMDRDKRWDRVQKAFDAMIKGLGIKENDPVDAINKSYSNNITDEFLIPTNICDSQGNPVGTIKSGDYIIFFNFRGDRGREISHALTDREFNNFERPSDINVNLTTFTQYEEGINCKVAFQPQYLINTLGEVYAKSGLTQLRIAETEKYAHVTFFFSGGREEKFAGEDRILIPSPKVATYDLQPEMSAPAVASSLAEQIMECKYDLIVNNFANGDMVGHTGILNAAIKAVEAVDNAIGTVFTALQKVGGRAIITADHGNAEMLWDFSTNQPHTAHTTNPTPFILIDDDRTGHELRDGGALCDVAPTILDIAGIDKPSDMLGQTLLI